jgi:type I restriction enzyme M protein
MPGQERVVLTKEVLVLRASVTAPFDNFYLLWALTLKAVRHQWDRIVFMQTNREDVGGRYTEIELPVPPDRATADDVSKAFRDFYLGTQLLRDTLLSYLNKDDRHHIFMSSSAMPPLEDVDDDDLSE